MKPNRPLVRRLKWLITEMTLEIEQKENEKQDLESRRDAARLTMDTLAETTQTITYCPDTGQVW